MTRLRIGLIGLGMAVAPHAKSLMDLSDKVEVRHAFSRSHARRQAFGKHYPFPLCDDLDAVICDNDVDAVFVLTPPSTHLEIVTRFLEAGKHVLLEKPLDVSTARAELLVDQAARSGLRLGVVLQHRFRPAARRLSARLTDGSLGAIAGVSTNMRLWRPQGYYDDPGRGTMARDGGGVLLTQGIHTLDLMLSLATAHTGPIIEVTGYAGTSPLHHMETEDMAACAVRFANGAIGVIDATTAAYPGFPERIEFICEKGTAVIEGATLRVYSHDGQHEEFTPNSPTAGGGGTGADPMAFPHDWHRDLIEDFVESCRQDRDPLVSGREALGVHRLIDAMLRSAKDHRPVKPEA